MNSLVAFPIAAAVPIPAPAMPADQSNDASAGSDRAADLARMEQIVDFLRTCYVREGWKIDDTAAERALEYSRQYAKDGSDPDDGREATIDFLGSHGQSLDWAFGGDVRGMICGLAKNSGRFADVADGALIALAEEYVAAEQRYCDLNLVVDRMDGECGVLPEALRIHPRDAELGRTAWKSTDEFWRRPCDINQWRSIEKWELVSENKTDDRFVIVTQKVKPSEELRVRAEEIVAAYDAWKAKDKKPRGYKKAVRERDRAERAYMRLEAQISETPASTIEGMRAKIRCAQAYMKTENIERIEGGSAAEVMALSIFRDLMGLPHRPFASTALKITNINNEPAKYGNLWWGAAVEDDDKLEWFYQPRLYLHMRREKRPGMWINEDPSPAAKRAVLKAVRAAKAA